MHREPSLCEIVHETDGYPQRKQDDLELEQSDL
jgi:hypothetical protein